MDSQPDGGLPSISRSLLSRDLFLVVIAVVLTLVVVSVQFFDGTVFRIVVAGAFLLFVPGYAFVAALFPTARPASDQSPEVSDGLTTLEFCTFSICSSLVIVPMLGLVLNYTPWGVRLLPLLSTFSLFTLSTVAIAEVRRARADSRGRERVEREPWFPSLRRALLAPTAQTDRFLAGVMLLSVLLATASVGYAVTVPRQEEPYTEAYLLTDDGSGNRSASGHSLAMTTESSTQLELVVVNNEHEQVTYAGVVQLQQVRKTNDSVTVTSRERLQRFNRTIPASGKWTYEHDITLSEPSDDARVTYLLYRTQVPESPTSENAYRSLHIYLNGTT